MLTPSQVLKQETRAFHVELEDAFVHRIAAVKTADDFADLLRLFYGFVAPIEQGISPHVNNSTLPDVAERKKLYLLTEAINSIHQNSTIHVATEVPQITSVCEALGAMYVLEGSTLGGKSIVRLLTQENRLSVNPSYYRYFNPYGDATGAMWTRFQQVLNEHGKSEDCLERIVRSANAIFNFITRYITTNFAP